LDFVHGIDRNEKPFEYVGKMRPFAKIF